MSAINLRWPANLRWLKISLFNFKIVCTNWICDWRLVIGNGIRSICLALLHAKIIYFAVRPTMDCCRTSYLHASSSCVQVRCHAVPRNQTERRRERREINISQTVASHVPNTHQLMLGRLSDVVHIRIIARIILIAIGWRIRGRSSYCRLIPCTRVKAYGCRCYWTRINGCWRP